MFNAFVFLLDRSVKGDFSLFLMINPGQRISLGRPLFRRKQIFRRCRGPVHPLHLEEMWAADNKARKVIATERVAVADAL
jgi:hypothetical protein